MSLEQIELHERVKNLEVPTLDPNPGRQKPVAPQLIPIAKPIAKVEVAEIKL